MISKRPSPSVRTPARLSALMTRARGMGVWVTALITVPRTVSLCGLSETKDWPRLCVTTASNTTKQSGKPRREVGSAIRKNIISALDSLLSKRIRYMNAPRSNTAWGARTTGDRITYLSGSGEHIKPRNNEISGPETSARPALPSHYPAPGRT